MPGPHFGKTGVIACLHSRWTFERFYNAERAKDVKLSFCSGLFIAVLRLILGIVAERFHWISPNVWYECF